LIVFACLHLLKQKQKQAKARRTSEALLPKQNLGVKLLAAE
jgi:hypothetical protein